MGLTSALKSTAFSLHPMQNMIKKAQKWILQTFAMIKFEDSQLRGHQKQFLPHGTLVGDGRAARQMAI
jgi:hypothetical protein